MKHKAIEKLIQKSLDHGISEIEEKILHNHLAHCRSCRIFLEELTQTTHLVENLIEFFPRPDFTSIVLGRLNIKRTAAWKKVSLVFGLSWLGSILLILFSPLPRAVLSRSLILVPDLLRFFQNVKIAVLSLRHFPFAFKTLIDPSLPIAGFVLSIFVFYFFGQTIKREVRCIS